jgi:hypothetical protein
MKNRFLWKLFFYERVTKGGLTMFAPYKYFCLYGQTVTIQNSKFDGYQYSDMQAMRRYH